MDAAEKYKQNPEDDPEFPDYVYDMLDILYENAGHISDRKKRKEYISETIAIKNKWLGEDAPNQRIK